MKKLLLIFGITAALPVFTQAQISITGQPPYATSYGDAYYESFNFMGASGTSYPEGWSGVRYAGSGAIGPLTLGITDGARTTNGGLYNVGSSTLADNFDRALGTLSSDTTITRFGVQFVNNSGAAIDLIQFFGISEQWRLGDSASANEKVSFEYSFNATDINDQGATFLPLSTMDLYEVWVASTAGGPVDGNSNQRFISGRIPDANWANGAALTIRWSDHDDEGNDGIYAIDDFSLRVGPVIVPEPSVFALFGLGALGILACRFRRLICPRERKRCRRIRSGWWEYHADGGLC